MRTSMVIVGSVLLGNWITEQYVFGKLIPSSPGFGLDDVARAGVVLGIYIAASKVL